MTPLQQNGNSSTALQLWADGHAYKTIAVQLGIKTTTVKEYIRRARDEYRARGIDVEGRAALLAALRKDSRA